MVRKYTLSGGWLDVVPQGAGSTHGEGFLKHPVLLIARVALALGASLGLTGCSQAPPEGGPLPPPVVTVSYPLEREVTDYNDFTGRTAAVESVKLRARVWGHLEKIHFAEGAEVKKGELLFVIDQRPYQAALARAEAEVAQSEAHAKRLESDHGRARSLLQSRAIAREEFDKMAGDLSEAQAAVRSALAMRETAKLNLGFTEVRAPVGGQISRALVTVGNLVESGETGGTVLTTIVSVDPMYAYFDVDDLTFMQVKQLVRAVGESKVRSAPEALPPVLLGLAGEQGYPHRGRIDFVDNQVDPGTGTLRMRGVFPNRDRVLTPGLFARIRVPLGDPHKALLVTDRAIDTDQGQKVLYVVNKENVVNKRLVRLGRLHDGLREIESGVRPGERVVVDGIQRVRGGITVEPKLVDMPVFEASRRGGGR
jgi:RND family efflux transporter MFP subunit